MLKDNKPCYYEVHDKNQLLFGIPVTFLLSVAGAVAGFRGEGGEIGSTFSIFSGMINTLLISGLICLAAFTSFSE